jgi:hypothetical protein
MRSSEQIKHTQIDKHLKGVIIIQHLRRVMKKINIVLPAHISRTVDITQTKNIWEYMGVPEPVSPCECDKCVKHRFDTYIQEEFGEVEQHIMAICADGCVCVRCVANSYRKPK